MTLGRPLLANPHWPYAAARKLAIDQPGWATLQTPYAHWLERYRAAWLFSRGGEGDRI